MPIDEVNQQTGENESAPETPVAPAFDWSSVDWSTAPPDAMQRALDYVPVETVRSHTKIAGIIGGTADTLANQRANELANQRYNQYIADLNSKLELKNILEADPLELGTGIQEKTKKQIEDNARQMEINSIVEREKSKAQLDLFNRVFADTLGVMPDPAQQQVFVEKWQKGEIKTFPDLVNSIVATKATVDIQGREEQLRKEERERVEQELRAKYNINLGTPEVPSGAPIGQSNSVYNSVEDLEAALARGDIRVAEFRSLMRQAGFRR